MSDPDRIREALRARDRAAAALVNATDAVIIAETTRAMRADELRRAERDLLAALHETDHE